MTQMARKAEEKSMWLGSGRGNSQEAVTRELRVSGPAPVEKMKHTKVWRK